MEPDAIKEIAQGYRRARQEANMDFARQFFQVVPKDQLELLRPKLLRRSVNELGLFTSMVSNAWLQKELKLTSSQLSKLREKMGVAHSRLESTLRNQEKIAWRRFLDTAPAAIERELTSELGEPTKQLPPRLGAFFR